MIGRGSHVGVSKRLGLIMVGGSVLAAVLVGCGEGGQPVDAKAASSADESAANGSGLLVDRLTAPDLATMAGRSELIVVGTVEGPPSYFVNPRDPADEPMPPDLLEGQKLETVRLRVEETIKGEHRDSLGIVQDDLRDIDFTDISTLVPGERVAVFLHPERGGNFDAAPDTFRVFAVDQGIFDVGDTTIEARAPELFAPGTVLPATLDQLRAMVAGTG